MQGNFKVDAPKMKEIDGKLYGEATGDANDEPVPLSDTMFLVKELNANLTFKKDASCKVSSIQEKIAGDERDARGIE